MRLEDTARIYTIGYMLEPIRVRFKKSITLDTLIKLDAKEDESRALPRWLARILATQGIVDTQDADMSIELLRALSREKISGDKLNTLKQDFYISIKEFIEQQEKNVNLDKLLVTLQDMMLLRLDKIMRYAKSAYAMQEIESKLSIEERILLKNLHEAISEFKDCITGR